jgi:hypothetical protein
MTAKGHALKAVAEGITHARKIHHDYLPLTAMSDPELRDIEISRCDISAVVAGIWPQRRNADNQAATLVVSRSESGQRSVRRSNVHGGISSALLNCSRRKRYTLTQCCFRSGRRSSKKFWARYAVSAMALAEVRYDWKILVISVAFCDV